MKFSFDPTQGLIVVPTRLTGPGGDVIVRLALDTGATATMVNWDIVVLLGYDPAAVEDRIQVTTGSGVEFAPRVKVASIEAIGRTRKDLPILCHTLPPSATVDGVSGIGLLSELSAVHRSSRWDCHG